MRGYKYYYWIQDDADRAVFLHTCDVLEKALPTITPDEIGELTDVDGTQIMPYTYNDGTIIVVNDYEEDEVCVLSNVNLDTIFPK